MKIRDILAKNEPTLSFEVFPPKTEDKYESVEMAASEIAKLNPAFMSVTYGAGGGTSQYTVDIAASLKAKGVTPLAHLTCVSSTREKVHSVLEQLKAEGIENVLALRGDIPKDGKVENDYRYASELIAEINIEDGVHQPGVRNQTKGINPAFRHRLRGAERHADVIGVFAEPAAEGDLDAARTAGFQEVDECRKEPNADFIGAAPVIGIPDRQEQPFFFRGLGQQVGECVDADGIIAAFFDTVEDSVPVLEACAVPAAFNP